MNFAVTLCGPAIWNRFLIKHEKFISHLSSFFKQTKFKLFNSNKETDYDLLLCPKLLCSLFNYLFISVVC